jgi:hypothetical protein
MITFVFGSRLGMAPVSAARSLPFAPCIGKEEDELSIH